MFLLAAEGLTCLLKTKNESSHLSGIRVAPSAPPVSHLLFADDSLLFVKAGIDGATELSLCWRVTVMPLVRALTCPNLRFSLVRVAQTASERKAKQPSMSPMSLCQKDTWRCLLMLATARMGPSNFWTTEYGIRWRDGWPSYYQWVVSKF